jgi:2-polyprenyl-6-methoxyphenol hydroxylase-like FAD-dependent oxidoreductase
MPKRIVILGCGPGGVTVANGLQDAATRGNVRVTILEKKDHVDLCT